MKLERLTERVIDENGNEHIFTKYMKDNQKLKDKKLCNLEDIEEELGIDLVTLFKALKNGAYFRNPYYKNEIKEFYILERNFSFTKKCFDIRMEQFVRFYDYATGGALFYFKDYGKTWALTKDELK